MTRIFIFIAANILVMIYSLPAFSSIEPVPARISPLATSSLLLDIFTVSNKHLIAVGERGHIIFSSDGENWQQADVPIQSTLTSVFFINEKQGWAVGHDASILYSSNGGETWEIQQYKPTIEKPLLDVIFKNPLNGIAVGAYGLFYQTDDGGLHWQEKFLTELLTPEDMDYLDELKSDDEEAYLDERSSILPHFNRIFYDGLTLFLVGEIGLIAKSNDMGNKWSKFNEIYFGSFYDIARTQQGNLLVIGLRGNVYRSIKNSNSWEKIEIESTSLLNTIILANDGRIFILGNNGVFLESYDDGLSFINRKQADGKKLVSGVWFNNEIIAVSDVGIKKITRTLNGYK